MAELSHAPLGDLAQLLGLAKVVTAEMPVVHAAWSSGGLSEYRAQIVARETAGWRPKRGGSRTASTPERWYAVAPRPWLSGGSRSGQHPTA